MNPKNPLQEYPYTVKFQIEQSLQANNKETALNLFKQDLPCQREIQAMQGTSMTIKATINLLDPDSPQILCDILHCTDPSIPLMICCHQCIKYTTCPQRCDGEPPECSNSSIR